MDTSERVACPSPSPFTPYRTRTWGTYLPGALEAIRAELEQAVAAQPEVRLSSAELYATHSSTAFRNSRGLSGAYEGTHVSLDLALLARSGDQEAEFHAMISRRRPADLQLAPTIAAYATYARDILHATPPATHSGPVILSGDALGQASAPTLGGGLAGFFAPVASRLPGRPLSRSWRAALSATSSLARSRVATG